MLASTVGPLDNSLSVSSSKSKPDKASSNSLFVNSLTAASEN